MVNSPEHEGCQRSANEKEEIAFYSVKLITFLGDAIKIIDDISDFLVFWAVMPLIRKCYGW